jgi:hypothetical protein
MRTLRGLAYIVILLTATSWIAVGLSQKAVGAEARIQTEQKTAPTIQELEQGIAARLQRVEEFKFIEEEAKKLGVKAYLFGGTAAGYAHYVKWDMQRERGDRRFQKDRFDYDYTNIYRSTQDLDIVIDGNPDQAQKLQHALEQKYPHLQGSKTAWEVRLLSQDMGDKQAILNNPDFMNQHTDSNSTGMIEITSPKIGEHVVRDVRDWQAKEPYFLKDVHDGMLHYYFSPLHETTKFAKEGRNPPILSAIRFLTKAFQYELTIRPEDLAHIKKIIQEFDPKQTAQNAYVANWIEKNGKKLVQNAVNIEYAWNTLEQLGLRDKLKSIHGNIEQVESLAWWMNKEPLRTQPIGQGSGKTAKELGVDVVAHETNSFLAYESITRAHTGEPNVLISRAQASGEAAAYGDGFYTKIGKEGARGTGLTIRFRVNPNAREGSDFVKSNDYVIVRNKAAISVIPETLNIGPLEYFRFLDQEKDFDASDRGIIEKLKRRIGNKLEALSGAQEEEVVAFIKQALSRPGDGSTALIDGWLSFPFSRKHPEIIDPIFNKAIKSREFALNILPKVRWWEHPKWVEKLLERGHVDDEIAQKILSKPEAKEHPEWLRALIEKGTVDKTIAKYVLHRPHWADHPEFMEDLIRNGNADLEIVAYDLHHPQWQGHPEFVETLLKREELHKGISFYLLTKSYWQDHPEWLETIIRAGTADENITQYVLTKDFWKNHPELRRLAGGVDPTLQNLRAAFERGETLRVSAPASGQCLIQNLKSTLSHLD